MMAEYEIETIILDYGMVLGGDGPNVSDIARITGADASLVAKAWEALVPKFQTGKLDENIFWSEFEGITKRKIDLQQGSPWLAGYRESGARFPQSWILVKHLWLAGMKTGILSNTIPPAAKYNRQAGNFFDFSPECVTLSCEVGAKKGDGRQIYDIAAEKTHTNIERCLFVDDKQAYVDEARQAGMKSIQFRYAAKMYPYTQLLYDLQKFIPDI